MTRYMYTSILVFFLRSVSSIIFLAYSIFVFVFSENDILIITAVFQEHVNLTNLPRYRCTELVQRAG